MKSILPSAEKNENAMDKLFDFIIEHQPNDDAKGKVKKALHAKTNRIAYDFMMDYVFTHNDLLGGNILYLSDSKEIKFIDFEYGMYNYRAFDFANNFCEYAGFDCDWNKHFPKEQHIKEVVGYYVAALCADDEYKKNVNKDVIALYMNRNDDEEYDAFLTSCAGIIQTFCC